MDNYELISKIKHDFGTKLLGINSCLNNINRVIEKNNLSNELINDNFQITVSDTLKTAKKTLEEIHNVLNKYENLTK